MSHAEAPQSSDSSWLRSEAVIDRFEQAWQDGTEPLIAEYLPVEGQQRLRLLHELIKIDLEYRWNHGLRQRLESYTAAFPELGDSKQLPIELIWEEYQVRRYHGDLPTADELRERFPARSEELSLLFETRPGRADGDTASDQSAAAHVASSASMLPGVGNSDVAGPALSLQSDRYELKEQVGRGGFATVYRAFDAELRRDVAIKIPRTDLVEGGPENWARLLREARSAARLRHPAIIPIYEVGRSGDQPFIVYEYVPGPTLGATLRDTQPASEQAADWVATIAEALHYAHQSGIIHRDVKPANIIMGVNRHAMETGNGTIPMLADFGLALQLGTAITVTRQGDILGTPAYMSPEQAAGRSHDVDARTDVYSLGVVLYELLSGQLPFRGSPASVLMRVIHQEPAPPSRVRRDIPSDLETICLKAMAKEPAHRYQTAAEMAEDLRLFLAHQPIRARRTSLPGRVLLWMRRKPALAATIAVATTVTLIVASASIWRVVQERDRYRVERDRAEANLYRALLSDANAQLRARDTGWWWQAMSSIRDAANLDVTARDPVQMRELAIQCMGSAYPSLRLRGDWEGHDDAVMCVAIRPDAKVVASGSRDTTVRLWEIPSGRTWASFPAHDSMVTSIAFHPSGHQLATSSYKGEVCVWDVANPALLSQVSPPVRSHTFDTGEGTVSELEFSPTGEWLAAACADGQVRLIAPDGSRPLRTLQGHSDHVLGIGFSSDGKRLASCGRDRAIRVWDVSSGLCTESWPTANTPNTVAFSFEQDFVAWGEIENFGLIFRRRSDTQVSVQSQLHTSTVHNVQWGSETHILSSSQDGTVKLGKVASTGYREIAVAQTESGEVTDAQWSKDERWVVTASLDGRVRLWEMAHPPQRLLTHGFTQRVVFLGDTRRLFDGIVLRDLSHQFSHDYQRMRPETINELAVHPDGSRYAFLSGEREVEIWDLSEQKQVASWRLDEGEPIRAVVASPDGRHLATASASGQVKLYDWAGQLQSRTWQLDIGETRDLVWVDGGRQLAALGIDAVALWPLEGQVPPRRLHLAPGLSARLASHGSWLAVALADGKIQLWDVVRDEVRHQLAHDGEVSALEFSADEKQLITFSRDRYLRVWDTATGKEVQRIEFDGQPPTWVTWQPSGNYVVVGGPYPRNTDAWDLTTGRVREMLHPFRGLAGRFLPGGQQLLLGVDFGSVRVIHAPGSVAESEAATGEAPQVRTSFETGPIVVAGGHWDRLWGLASSANGRWIATAAHDQDVKLWDVHERRLVRTLSGHTTAVWCATFSPDSKQVASGAVDSANQIGEIRIWDVESGRLLRTLEGHRAMVTGLSFHPSGRWLASCSLDGGIRVWDMTTGQSWPVYQFPRPVYSLSLRPDGRWLAAGSIDHRVAVWSFDAILASRDTSTSSGAATVSSPATEGQSRVPQPSGGLEPDHWLTDHVTAVYSVQWSRDNRYLAAGAEQGVIQLWDGETFARIVKLEGGTGQIRHLDFSYDGELLAAAGYVAPLLVWDLDHVRRTLREMNLDWETPGEFSLSPPRP